MSFVETVHRGSLLYRPLKHKAQHLLNEAELCLRRELSADYLQASAECVKRALPKLRSEIGGLRFRSLAEASLGEMSLPEGELFLDSVRLRAVSPGLENVVEAEPVFYCHRDTWYGNPACQVNCWLPLHPVDSRNSFCFFPDHFSAGIKNDSERFQASDFEGKGGFGRINDKPIGAYPRALEEPRGARVVVEMARPSWLFFSAHHLHRTLENRSPENRFSLDFRFFLAEHLKRGTGPPEMDNRSRGLCLRDYRACSF